MHIQAHICRFPCMCRFNHSITQYLPNHHFQYPYQDKVNTSFSGHLTPCVAASPSLIPRALHPEASSYSIALSNLAQQGHPYTLSLFHDETSMAEEVLAHLTALLFQERQVALRVGIMREEELVGFEGQGDQSSELDLTLLVFVNASVCERFLGSSTWQWLSGALLLVSLEDSVRARYVTRGYDS